MNTWRRKGRIGAGLNCAALTQQRYQLQSSCSCRRCTLKPAVGKQGQKAKRTGRQRQGRKKVGGQGERPNPSRITLVKSMATVSVTPPAAPHYFMSFVDLTTDRRRVRLLHVFLDLRSGLNPDWVTCRITRFRFRNTLHSCRFDSPKDELGKVAFSSMFLKRKKSQRFGASSFYKCHYTRQKDPFASLGRSYTSKKITLQ